MWDIVGHQNAVQVLSEMISANRVPHALLLTGPASIGKRRLAIEFAKALNCVGAQPPCQQCVHCRQTEAGFHPDVVVIEPGEGKTGIAIAQVRVLRDDASLRPFQGRVKVFIVDQAETLTDQAADALLKTLEEPQPQVQMVLIAVDADALPATILSRCRVLSLQPVEQSAVAGALLEKGATPKDAERLSRLARGRIGWALRAMSQTKLAEQQEELVERLIGVLDLDLLGRLALVETLTAERKDRAVVRRALEVLVLLARDLMLLCYDRRPLMANTEQAERLRLQSRRLGAGVVLRYLQRLRLTLDRIDQNVDPRLALEALLTDMP
ncbi:MAG: ATP-binding protein [Chloroflexota bacterium]